MGELICIVGVPVPPELDVVANFKALWVGCRTTVFSGLDVIAGRGRNAPAPVRMTTRTPGSASASSMARRISFYHLVADGVQDVGAC